MPEKFHLKKDSLVFGHLSYRWLAPVQDSGVSLFSDITKETLADENELKELGYVRRGPCHEPGLLGIRQVKEPDRLRAS